MQAVKLYLKKEIKKTPYGTAGTVKQQKHWHRHMHTHSHTHDNIRTMHTHGFSTVDMCLLWSRGLRAPRVLWNL